MSHIFISYSHKDKDYVHKLHLALIERGFDAWIDDRIDYGARWPREIEKRLRESSAFVLVMSPHSNESEWVENELETARELKKPIFPLLLDGSIWWHLRSTQTVNVTDGKLPPENFFIHLASSVARHQTQIEYQAAEKPKNDGISVHIGGNVSGNVIIGNENAASSGVAGAGRETRAEQENKPLSVENKALPIAATRAVVQDKPKTIQPKRNLTGIAAIIGVCLVTGIIGAYILSTLPNVVKNAPATETSAPQPQSSATVNPYPTEIIQKDAPMELIPAGSFTMGSDTGNADEKPPHTVSLPTFYMDKYEVTNAIYKDCVDAKGCTAPSDSKSDTRASYYGNSEFYNYPVIYVSWDQATAYCLWRGARLPSEAEWEYAARSTDGRTYPWGDGIDSSRANYNTAGKDTTAVGSYESGKSPFGVYDMAGNVWEWVNDWYDVYPGGDAKASIQFGQKYRVLRGGAWNSGSDNLRTAFRSANDPNTRGHFLGFRCALSP